MPARVAFSRGTATVTPVDGEPVTYDELSVLVKAGGARLKDQMGRQVREKVGVLSTERVSGNHWMIVFVDGETWEYSVDRRSCVSCS